jgi:tryptophan halogenase
LIKRIIVVGGGSAAFLCALGLKTKLPDLTVRVIPSEPIDELGLDSSTVPLTRYLHGFLGIDARKFVQLARPSWKLGTRFEKWGARDHFYFPFGTRLDRRLPNLPRSIAYYCDADMDYATPQSTLMAQDKVFFRNQNGAPAWHWDFAYHLDPPVFAAGIRTLAATAGVEIADDSIRLVLQDEAGVSGLVMDSGQTENADFYVDCSGTRSLLLGEALKEAFVSFKKSLPCDRIMLSEWERSDEPLHPYTTCETMDSGWCWQIELERKIARGYVYCSDFTSDEKAEEEFRRKNPRAGAMRVAKFTGGRYERGWVKNVVAIGNSEGFVEPLQSTALGVIAARCQLLSEILVESNCQVPAAHVRLYNRHHGRIWDGTRRVLAIQYRFNTSQRTPFWEMCRRDVDLAGAEPIVEYYRQCGPNSVWGPLLTDPVDPFNASAYLTILVGQKLPTKASYEVSAHERAVWDAEQQRYRAAAMQGLSVAEALAALPPYQPTETSNPAVS